MHSHLRKFIDVRTSFSFLLFKVAGFMNFYVRTVTEMEMQMNATERIRYYTSIENEQYEGKHECLPTQCRRQ